MKGIGEIHPPVRPVERLGDFDRTETVNAAPPNPGRRAFQPREPAAPVGLSHRPLGARLARRGVCRLRRPRWVEDSDRRVSAGIGAGLAQAGSLILAALEM